MKIELFLKTKQHFPPPVCTNKCFCLWSFLDYTYICIYDWILGTRVRVVCVCVCGGGGGGWRVLGGGKTLNKRKFRLLFYFHTHFMIHW